MKRFKAKQLAVTSDLLSGASDIALAFNPLDAGDVVESITICSALATEDAPVLFLVWRLVAENQHPGWTAGGLVVVPAHSEVIVPANKVPYQAASVPTTPSDIASQQYLQVTVPCYFVVDPATRHVVFVAKLSDDFESKTVTAFLHVRTPAE